MMIGFGIALQAFLGILGAWEQFVKKGTPWFMFWLTWAHAGILVFFAYVP